MRIESLKLNHFRNYEQLELTFDPGTNLFYGDNAQGKTNVLEAVYLCGTTKSHRQGKDREMISFSQDEAHIRMEIVAKDIPYRIDMHLKKNRAKGIAINGVPIHRASELIGLGNFVFFSPEDLNIVKSGPSERRKFMDMELSQLDKVYVHALAGYQKALLQRNKLLKDLRFYEDGEGLLDVWDDQLVSYGKRIIEERERFVQRLGEVILTIHEKLTGGREQLQVVYAPNVTAEEFADRLSRERERDKKMRTTLLGPHKDDLFLISNGIDIRRYGSQGQQRTCALSLKLAEIELVRRVSGEMPVLLLDDVLSELDAARQHFLLESISHIQTLITCTGVDEFTANSFKIDKLFHVRNGEIQEDSDG